MIDLIVPSVAGAFGTVAFGILYHVNPKHLVCAFFGGLLTSFALLLFDRWTEGNNMICNFVAAFVGGVYCTICAHKRHAPVPVFMIPTIFPLVPGKALYYAMSGLVMRSGPQFNSYFTAAIEISIGIAIGIMFSTVICNMILGALKKR